VSLTAWVHLHEADNWRGYRIIGPAITCRGNPSVCDYHAHGKCFGWLRLSGSRYLVRRG
jgi:hypothetical protein